MLIVVTLRSYGVEATDEILLRGLHARRPLDLGLYRSRKIRGNFRAERMLLEIRAFPVLSSLLRHSASSGMRADRCEDCITAALRPGRAIIPLCARFPGHFWAKCPLTRYVKVLLHLHYGERRAHRVSDRR